MSQLQAIHRNLMIPPQTLAELSLTSAQPKKFEQWLHSLPKGHIGQTAKQIYQISHELGQLKTNPQHRLELLELVRPIVLNLLPSLSKHYLNQAIVLPDKAAKVATLTQALLSRTITAYKVVIVEMLDSQQLQKNDATLLKSLKIALHRAMSLSTLQLLHNFQLYSLVPNTLWHDLYQFYLLADKLKLLHEPVRATRNSENKSSINQEFLRAVMLSTASPNQLRQSQIKALFDASSLWSQEVSIQQSSQQPAVFYLDLLSDSPPSFFNWQTEQKNAQMRSVLFGALVEKFSYHIKNADTSDLVVPDNIDMLLLSHLCRTWSNASQRVFARTPQQGSIDIVIGFTASHYFLAGEMEFNTFVRGGEPAPLQHRENNPFLTHDPLSPISHDEERMGVDDIWSFKYTAPVPALSSANTDSNNLSNNEAGPTSLETAIENNINAHKKTPATAQCMIIDISPSGYCIEWQSPVSALLRTGEIMALKDHRTAQWLIGAVRWLKQATPTTVRAGIELLSPNGIACGASVIHKKAPQSDMIRVIELPAITTIGQKATLLTPVTGFHEGDKIVLSYLQNKTKAKLVKRIASSPSYHQFQFELLAQDSDSPKASENLATKETLQSPSANDDFNNLWHLI